MLYTVCNFQSIKCPVELNSLFLKFFLSYHLVKSFLGPREIFRVLRGSRGSRASRQGSWGVPGGHEDPRGSGVPGGPGDTRGPGPPGLGPTFTPSLFACIVLLLYMKFADLQRLKSSRSKMFLHGYF